MAEELPIACSLDVSGLEQRLAEIGALGAESLVSRERERDRHLLRFRNEPGTRDRLEAIIAAEAECCAFLELSLTQEDGLLVLTVAAPADGRRTAEGLADAFGPPLARSSPPR
jgi:hypothetical protein